MVAKSKTSSKIIQNKMKNHHRDTESTEKTAISIHPKKDRVPRFLDEKNSVFSVSLW